MQKVKNFICTFLGIIMLLPQIQVVEASQYRPAPKIVQNDIINIQGGPLLTNLYYNGQAVLGTSSFFYEDGKQYPAYCLQPNQKGAGEHPDGNYDIKTEWTFSEPQVIGMVLNGFPYKTPAELGVDTELEAYEITKAAIWTVSGNSTYTNVTGWSSSNTKLLTAYNNLVELGKQNTEVFSSNSIAATAVASPEVVDGQYTKQTFEVTSDFPVKSYTVALKGSGFPSGTEIRDELGATAKTSFTTGEKFTIYIPTSGLTAGDKGNVQVDISAVVESKVIFAGPPTSEETPGTDFYQDYLVPKPEQYASTTASTPYDKKENIKPTPTPTTTPTTPTPEPEKQPNKLTIRKVEAGTTKGLSGAIFEVTDEKGGVVYQGHTDGSGEITINVPSSGKYSVTELVPPDGFQLSDHKHQDIIIKDDMESQIVTFENRPTTNLEVTKVDADTNEPLKGATIKLSLDGGNQSWTLTTDSSGKVVFPDLPDGTYSLEELVAPSGYLLAEKCKQTIKIVGGVAENQTAVFKNKKKPGILILKVDETTGEPLNGAEFQIKKKDGSIVYEGLTGDDGTILVEGLDDGWYDITELAAPEHYLKRDESKEVYLESGKQVQIKFDNRRRPALEILKIDEETSKPLAGAKFVVKKTEDNTTSEYVTDSTGRIVIEDLDEAIYSVEEIVAPSGYIIDTQHKDIELEWGKTKTLVFTNKAKPKLKIIKLDEDTKKPLAGAKFKVTKTDDNTVSEYVTKEDGTILIENLEDTTYTVVETQAPFGYLLSENSHKDIKLEWGKTKELIFTNQTKPKLRIQKVDAKTGELLKNSEFRVEKVEDKTVSEYILENGEIILENLDEAIYKATEFMPPDGYIMLTESKEIMLEGGKTKTLKFDNVRKPVVRFKKTNGLTGKPIAGAVFKVEYEIPNGSTKVIGSFTTDSNGLIVIPKAEVGWYIFTEIKPAPGFSLNKTPIRQYFNAGDNAYTAAYNQYYSGSGTGKFASGYVENDGTTNPDSNSGTSTGSVANSETGSSSNLTSKPSESNNSGGFTSTLGTINQSNASIHSGSEYYVEGEGFNWPLNSLVIKKIDANTGELLDGAAFEVYKTDEAVSGQPGTSIGRVVTDNSGVVVVVGLEPGYYVVKEVQAPQNYILAETSLQNGFLKPDGTSVIEFTFRNYPYGNILIKKVDSVTKKPLAGVKFKVTNGAGELIGNQHSYTTDANGEIIISNVEPNSYVITEIETLSNYIIDNEPKTIQVGTDGKTYTVEFKNNPYGSLVISKVDAITRKPLEGVKFKVVSSDGSAAGNTNGIYTTNANGEIIIPNLAPNSYIVTEIESIAGYQIDTTPQTIEIKANQETYKVEFKNQPFGTLVIKKLDAKTKEPLGEGEFKVTTSKGDVVGNSNGIYKTDVNGLITIPNLPKGSYIYEEIKAPNGYILENEANSIDIEWGKTHVVEVYNNKKSGLQIVKIDAKTKEPLKDAKFKIYKKSGELMGEYTTDGDGLIILDNLEPGWYKAVESKAPEGYLIDETPKDFEITNNQFVKLVFENQKKSGLQIIKIDGKTKEPLKDAKFKIYKKSGDLIGEYTTDGDGLIILDNLEPGWYKAVETKSPEGYLIDETPKDFEITNNQFVKLVFENQKKSGLQIIKIDGKTKEPLKDAKFKIYKKSGDLIGEYTTDGDGLIIIDNLEPGWYKAVETKSPSGYKLDETPKDFEITNNQFVKLVFENEKLASLIIKKVDDKSGEPLAGAKFTIEKQDGTHIGEYSTDSDGTINVPQVTPGWYVIREKFAPDGYLLDETPKTIEVKTNTPTIVTFTNKKLTSLQIKKIDETSGKALAGAVFEISRQNGEKIYTSENGTEFVTDANGFINIPTLDPDFYIVTEKKAPDGYILDSTPKTVQVKTDSPTLVTFTNKYKSGLQIIKVDEQTNEPLGGAKFTVYKKSGDIIGEYTTDGNGVIILDQLENGWYKLAETKAPDGYMISEEPKDIEITGNDFHKIVFTNKKLTSLQIKKIDETSGKALAGAVFEVSKQNGEKIYTSENGTEFVTDANGFINIPTLEPDFYIVTEKKAPDGYILDSTPKTVQVKTGSPTVVTFTNKYKSGLQIIKVDADTNEPLAGAKFTVYKKSGDVIGEYTTDANGVIILDQLENGWYKIAETKAPDGYAISEEPKDIEITGNDFHKIIFKDKKLSGLVIKKIDSFSEKPLAGAVFEITKVNGEKVAEVKTDKSGIALVPNVSSGTLIVTEKKAPDGYVLDTTPKTIEVKNDGKSIELVFENKPQAGLQIKKINSETREPIQGVIFSLTKMNGEKVGEFKTDKEGMAYVNNVEAGTYILTEIKAADGYLKDGEPRHIEIKNDGKPNIIEVENKPASGLLIVKTDAKTGKPLAGVIFDVRRADGQRVQGNILDENMPNTLNNSPNKNTTANGDIGGSYTTDANGRILLNHLLPGEYHVIETKALEGYILDTDVHAVTITAGKQVSLQLTNMPKGGIRIKKIDSVTKNGIMDVEFRVFDFITNKEVAGPFYTDNNGEIDFEGILPEGKYKIMETREAVGYLRDQTPRTLEFKAGQILEIVWENQPLMGQIQITKKSASDNEVNGLPKGTPLAGAVFEVYHYKTGNLVDRFESGNNGIAVSNPLPIGRYKIKEVVSPKYYKISEQELDVEIEFSSQIVKLEFTNEPANTGVEIKKVGPTEVVGGQQIKYDIKYVKNSSTVPLTSFFWRDVVPTDALRINKIVTGTYSQALRFKIMYKTNKNDYRVAADNLSTTTNHVVDLSPQALGIPNDEVITEVMLVFGNVKAGFCQVEQPQILATVVNGLPNGHKFANKVDVGGKYGEEWVIGNSTWTSTIYTKTAPTLPRTGY